MVYQFTLIDRKFFRKYIASSGGHSIVLLKPAGAAAALFSLTPAGPKTKVGRVVKGILRSVHVSGWVLVSLFISRCLGAAHSEFHLLAEFDEAKRNCWKCLDGHNRHRRKPQPESLSMNSRSLFSNHQD